MDAVAWAWVWGGSGGYNGGAVGMDLIVVVKELLDEDEAAAEEEQVVESVVDISRAVVYDRGRPVRQQ
ncbi:hypothetical protein Sjap_015561 [Stephania japonica]|uniref:Uncharacterized protein n=1 Tax=Stephania japonica TaxID=461633 RepID=A0AAP0IJE2_9MAGN